MPEILTQTPEQSEQPLNLNDLIESLNRGGVEIQRENAETLNLICTRESKQYKIVFKINPEQKPVSIKIYEVSSGDQMVDISSAETALRILINIRAFIQAVASQYMLPYTKFSFTSTSGQLPVNVDTTRMDSATKEYIFARIIPILRAFNFDARRVSFTPDDNNKDRFIKETFEQMFTSGYGTIQIVFSHIVKKVYLATNPNSQQIRVPLRIPLNEITKVMNRLAQQPNGGILITGEGLDYWEFSIEPENSGRQYSVTSITLNPNQLEKIKMLTRDIKVNIPVLPANMPVDLFKTYIDEIIAIINTLNQYNKTDLITKIDSALRELRELLSLETHPLNIHLFIVFAQRLIHTKNIVNQLFSSDSDTPDRQVAGVCPLRSATTAAGESLYQAMIKGLLIDRRKYVVTDLDPFGRLTELVVRLEPEGNGVIINLKPSI